MVVVTGTEDNIKCSNGACSLADAQSKAAYLSLKATAEGSSGDSGEIRVEVWKDEGLGQFFFIKEVVPEDVYRQMQNQNFALAA